MTPAERKQAIRDAGLTYEAIGRRLRPPVSAKTVWAQVHEMPGQQSERVRRAIARALGRAYEDVFPPAAAHASAESAA